MNYVKKVFYCHSAKTGPGPAAYAVEHNDVGHTCEAVKTTIKGRMNSKYWPGFSSGLEMPCDAPGTLYMYT